MRYLIYLFLFLSSAQLLGQEVIHSFDAVIEVDTSSDLIVTERISVRAENRRIKRGIYRALKTFRKDKDGKSYPISYTILSIKQNDRRAVFHTKEESGKLLIYIGEKNKILAPGNYTYEIKYKTYGQIGYFPEFNELYWNVNGTEWELPAQSVSAKVILPEGTGVLETNCYTGAYGSNAKNCDAFIDPYIGFQANQLRPKENLTISVAFQKGSITEPAPPTWLDRYRYLLIGLLSMFGLLAYYLFTWNKHGRDPIKPAVYPIYDPPEGLSPAGVASVKSDRVRTDLITASLINLAVKGFITIEEQKSDGVMGMFKSNTYTLTKLKNGDDNLFNEEKALMTSLFSGKNKITLDGQYQSDVRSAVVLYDHQVKSSYEDIIETGRNTSYLILPILLTVAFLFLTFWLGDLYLPASVLSFISGGFFFMMFALFFLLPIFVKLIKKINTNGIYITAGILTVGVIALLFYLPKVDLNLYVLIGFMAFAIISLILYKYLIEQPTEEKLKLQSLVEGFKMYMGAAENNQIQHFNPPEMTPERFEKLLPYAIALGVDKVWGEKFQSYLQSTAAAASYSSPWYRGNRMYAPDFYHVMNRSVSQGIHQTSTPPSESGGGSWSSGSGGGGFSGGGGGGGGGGGW